MVMVMGSLTLLFCYWRYMKFGLILLCAVFVGPVWFCSQVFVSFSYLICSVFYVLVG